MSDERHPPAAEAGTLQHDFPMSYAIFAMARVHKAMAASALAEIGLFPNQDVMIVQLAASAGLSQKTLASTLRVSHVTVVKMVARMEKAGLVSRRTSRSDRRITLVSLTDAGRALHEQVLDIWRDLEEATTQHLSTDDRRVFLDVASRIRPALEAAADPSAVQPA